MAHSVPLSSTPFDRLALSARVSGTATWTALGAMSVVCVGAIYLWNPHIQLIRTFMPLAVALFFLPLAVRWGSQTVRGSEPFVKRFVKNEEPMPVAELFEQRFRGFAVARGHRWVGAVYIVVAVPAFWLGGSFSDLTILQSIIAGIVLLLSAFACGISISSVIHLSRLIWRIGDYPVVVEDHPFGVLSLGRVILKVYCLACGVWFIYAFSASGSLENPLTPVFALAAPSVLLLVGTFVGCQFPIHRQMVADKAAQVEAVYRLLRDLQPQQVSELTTERLEHIEKLQALAERQRRLPEWPFGWKVLVGVFGGAVGAVSPTAIGFVLTRVFPGP